MGGTSLEDGLTTSSLNPKCCDKLRCYDCHKKVVKYRDRKWKSSVDYLFVRNHVTNLRELEKVNELTNIIGIGGSFRVQCLCLSMQVLSSK